MINFLDQNEVDYTWAIHFINKNTCGIDSFLDLSLYYTIPVSHTNNTTRVWTGFEGLCSWGWKLVQQLSRFRRISSLGILSLQHSRVQQGGMLGSSQGGWSTFWWAQWIHPTGQKAARKSNKQLGSAKGMWRGLQLLFSSNEYDDSLATWWPPIGDLGDPPSLTGTAKLGKVWWDSLIGLFPIKKVL